MAIISTDTFADRLANSSSSVGYAVPLVVVAIFAGVDCLVERSDIADEDRLVGAAKQTTMDSWTTRPVGESQTHALALHRSQANSRATPADAIVREASSSDRVDGMYSTWTHFYFHAFSILFIAGMGILIFGLLLALPLVSAFGPLVLGAAFGCLWRCVRRASQEHAV